MLLQRVAGGDEGAFAQLFYQYKDKLFSFIYDITHSEAQAEDVVQEVFLKIWQQREKITEVEHFNAYVFRMCRNNAIDQLRKLSRESLLQSVLLQPDEAQPVGSDEMLLAKEVREKLQEAVAQLPPQQKKIFLLHKEKGWKPEEIAREMDLSVSTVRNHLFRAVGGIRQYLNTTYPDISLSISILIALSLLG